MKLETAFKVAVLRNESYLEPKSGSVKKLNKRADIKFMLNDNFYYTLIM